MRVTSKHLLALTAADLMTPDVVRLSETMPLREAARLLLQHRIGGAPVVDAQGRCVGVLSAIDFVRLAEKREEVTTPTAPPLPSTCQFQVKFRVGDGKEATLCTLPLGVCPLQEKQRSPDGKEMVACSQPHTVLTDWQVVEVEKLPADEVCRYMTADPVTVESETPIRTLARMMMDAHIHRILVVDEQQRLVGIVSGTDILSAVAYAESV